MIELLDSSFRSMRPYRHLLLGAAVAALLVYAPIAHATFPGENGAIAYSLFGYSGTGPCGPPADIEATSPFGETSPLAGSPNRDDLDPSYSSNGRWLLYESRDPSNFEICGGQNRDCPCLMAMGAGGENKRRLPVAGSNPSFSPDGHRIVFQRGTNDTPRREIWIVRSNGTHSKRLTDNNVGDSSPVFSPRADKIAFVREADIWVMDSDGTNERRLVMLRGKESAIDYSPDGKRLVFSRERRGEAEIWTIRASGGNPRSLPTPQGFYGTPVFSPDGTLIAFPRHYDDSFNPGLSAIFVMATDGTGLRQVTAGSGRFPSDLSWQAVRN